MDVDVPCRRVRRYEEGVSVDVRVLSGEGERSCRNRLIW